MSFATFLLMFGVLLLLSPGLIMGAKAKDDPQEVIIRYIQNTDLQRFMTLQGLTLSGFCFLLIGLALLFV